MNKEFGAEVELIKGGGGIFDITVDGQLAFSKFSTGRFPTEDDLHAIGS